MAPSSQPHNYVPQLGPLTLIVGDPVPLDFCTENFIALRKISQPETPIDLRLANHVPFSETLVVRGFVPSP